MTMQLELKHIQRELSITVIYVTHDQSEAMAMADRIGVMNGGRLLQGADPQTIYAAPANHFVARFIGECSILRVTPVDEGGGYEICGARQALPAPASSPFEIVVRPESVFIHEIHGQAAGGRLRRSRDDPRCHLSGAGWRVALHLSDGQSLLASVMRGDTSAGDLVPGKTVITQWWPSTVAILAAEGST